MTKKFNKSYCSVFIQDGLTRIITPDGNVIGGVISTRLTEEIKDFEYECVQELTLIVNLCESQFEAMENYKDAKTSKKI